MSDFNKILENIDEKQYFRIKNVMIIIKNNGGNKNGKSTKTRI